MVNYEVSVSRNAEELKRDDLFEMAGKVFRVLSTLPRVGQPGATLIRFKLKSDVSNDFYTMWINSKFTFEVLIPKRSTQRRDND